MMLNILSGGVKALVLAGELARLGARLHAEEALNPIHYYRTSHTGLDASLHTDETTQPDYHSRISHPLVDFVFNTVDLLVLPSMLFAILPVGVMSLFLIGLLAILHREKTTQPSDHSRTTHASMLLAILSGGVMSLVLAYMLGFLFGGGMSMVLMYMLSYKLSGGMLLVLASMLLAILSGGEMLRVLPSMLFASLPVGVMSLFLLCGQRSSEVETTDSQSANEYVILRRQSEEVMLFTEEGILLME